MTLFYKGVRYSGSKAVAPPPPTTRSTLHAALWFTREYYYRVLSEQPYNPPHSTPQIHTLQRQTVQTCHARSGQIYMQDQVRYIRTMLFPFRSRCSSQPPFTSIGEPAPASCTAHTHVWPSQFR